VAAASGMKSKGPIYGISRGRMMGPYRDGEDAGVAAVAATDSKYIRCVTINR
jgi:hypothetical protein